MTFIVMAGILTSSPAQAEKAFTAKTTWYVPKKSHVQEYGTIQGKAFLCAHRTLRATSILEVTANGRTAIVEVCGYGPAKWTGKDLDLSPAAFERLAPLSRGVINTKVQVLYEATPNSRLNPKQRAQWLQKNRTTSKNLPPTK